MRWHLPFCPVKYRPKKRPSHVRRPRREKREASEPARAYALLPDLLEAPARHAIKRQPQVSTPLAGAVSPFVKTDWPRQSDKLPLMEGIRQHRPLDPQAAVASLRQDPFGGRKKHVRSIVGLEHERRPGSAQ